MDGPARGGQSYVNRQITGAIVGRQPFGGWKASSMGSAAKAGGPNYVLQLARWIQAELPAVDVELPPPVGALLARCLEAPGDAGTEKVLRAAASSYAQAWQEHFARAHETAHVLGEENVLRYRPCRSVLVRVDGASARGSHGGRPGGPRRPGARRSAGDRAWPAAALAVAGRVPGVTVTVESEAGLAERLAAAPADRAAARARRALA